MCGRYRSPPAVNAGTSLADEYKFDLLGIDQTLFGSGWEMGTFAAVPEFVGRGEVALRNSAVSPLRDGRRFGTFF